MFGCVLDDVEAVKMLQGRDAMHKGTMPGDGIHVYVWRRGGCVRVWAVGMCDCVVRERMDN